MSLISRNPLTKEILGTFSFETMSAISNKLATLENKKNILKKMETKNKQDILKNFANELNKRSEELNQIISLETGKSTELCEHEINCSIRYLEALSSNGDSMLKSLQTSSDTFKKVSLIKTPN
jgi:acyl-CoA reductase-like NAD-dependent aldehyde dehydrogenase